MIDVAYTHPRGARQDPSGGELEFLSRYDGLRFFRLTPLGAYCLELAESYVPSTPAARASLSVFPDLRVQVAGGTLTPDEQMLLETYAAPESEGGWRLDHARTVAAIENGASRGRTASVSHRPRRGSPCRSGLRGSCGPASSGRMR